MLATYPSKGYGVERARAPMGDKIGIGRSRDPHQYLRLAEIIPGSPVPPQTAFHGPELRPTAGDQTLLPAPVGAQEVDNRTDILVACFWL